jgi:aspartyl-tRNA synthetase
MFEWNEDEQRLEALHHPFTAPHPEDMGDLKTARALAYDLVYNGVEVCFSLHLSILCLKNSLR